MDIWIYGCVDMWVLTCAESHFLGDFYMDICVDTCCNYMKICRKTKKLRKNRRVYCIADIIEYMELTLGRPFLGEFYWNYQQK